MAIVDGGATVYPTNPTEESPSRETWPPETYSPSRRDFFAAMALQGLLAQGYSTQYVVKEAWLIADEMIGSDRGWLG